MLQLETKFFNNNSHDTESTLNRDLNSAQVRKKKQKLNVLPSSSLKLESSLSTSRRALLIFESEMEKLHIVGKDMWLFSTYMQEAWVMRSSFPGLVFFSTICENSS